jgi:hypothetical protein
VLRASFRAAVARFLVRVGGRLRRLGPGCFERASPRFDLSGSGLEPFALLLELDPAGGELLLDAACLLRPFLEFRALGARKLAFRQRVAHVRLRQRELGGQLALALLDPLDLAFELGGAIVELTLTRFERLCSIECGSLAGDEGIRVSRLRLLLLARFSLTEARLELGELALARRDRLGTLAQRLLQAPQLGAGVLLLGLPLLREFACQAEQRLPIEVHARVVGSDASAPAAVLGRP